ncbi:MAG: PfkB family carbohydrate kinase [Candidatus Bathyarchaeia archaeon]
MALHASDVTVVGHFTIDTIHLPEPSSPVTILGGPAAYVSLAARRLDASVSVISRVGGDFPEAYLWWLGAEGIDLSSVIKRAEEQTTRFKLEYGSDLADRKLTLTSRAAALDARDLPRFLCAKAVHIAPVAGEVSYEVVEQLRASAEVLSLDPQGLLRQFDEAGAVTLQAQADNRLLSLIDVYKSSQDEISTLTGHADLTAAIKGVHDFGVETVIVTLGTKGAVLSENGVQHTIPACRSRKVVDPTGAGDTFIGGFLAEYIRQKDPLWCACVGSAAASLVVEGVGPTFFGEKEEIYERARGIYEKEIKQ